MNRSRTSLLICCALLASVALLLGAFSIAGMEAAPTDQEHLFLPTLFDQREDPVVFDPPEDTVLSGGGYTFISMTIRSGVTVTTTGNLNVTVLGDAEIAGELVADCTDITVLAQGELTVTGVVDNECSGDATNPGDISLYSDGGNIAIGTMETPVTLRSSGGLDVGNDPNAQEWEYDVLPHQRAASSLAPVCAATADTLVDSVFADSSIEVAFAGEGADPDGGPLYYEWDFGDGDTAAGRDPVHAYDSPGVYDVTLTVTDDDGQPCTATLRLVLDDGGEIGQPDQPAVAADPQRLVVATGEDAYFTGDALDPAGDEVNTYTWDLDGAQMSGPAITHTFAMTGRYDVTLTVTDTGGITSTATASVYVYDSAAQPDPARPDQGTCVAPGPNVFNAVYDGGKASDNRRGRQARFRGQGHIFLGSGTNIQAQHGGDGEDRSGSGTVIARRGRRGGSLVILVRGSLTICGGASLASGDGGAGGTATSDTPPTDTAYARGGNGGPAAYRLWIATTQGLAFESPFGFNIILNPGSGGDGGLADADGQDGDDRCAQGQDGANARARGGKGGRASKTVVVWGNVTGTSNAEIQGGMGGNGGYGDAFGGYGGVANCQSTATGGDGGWAYARGGRGGHADLSGAFALFTLAPDAFTAGDGGNALAFGGYGGDATATAPACTAAEADGGHGANARAFGGHAGHGRINGGGGNGDADAGEGGDATATGGDCDGCGNPGGDATATAGDAGLALARYGRGAPDGAATSSARDGGHAVATGGAGGHCDECPGGAGGVGGAAHAAGGDGGDAQGNGALTGGNGGDGDATGGRGGDGADCCAEPGGNGGDGGDATSTAGEPGSPGGSDGANDTRGGHGGDAGDGKPPGTPGAGGAGAGDPVDIPDGDDGTEGELCANLWFIYHSSITDGAIAPGTVISLSTYITTDAELTPTGQVTLTFLSQADGGFDYLPSYEKNGSDLHVEGGLEYDLSDIPTSSFPVDSAQVTIQHTCQNPDCLQLIGQTTEGDFTFAGNEMTTTATGPPVMETLYLPFQTDGPYYEAFRIVIWDPFAFFEFDHWAIIIIDP